MCFRVCRLQVAYSGSGVVSDFLSSQADNLTMIIDHFSKGRERVKFCSDDGFLVKAENESGIVHMFMPCLREDDYIVKVNKC